MFDPHDTDDEQDEARGAEQPAVDIESDAPTQPAGGMSDSIRGAFSTIDRSTGNSINKAVAAVKNVFAYGRKKHGLSDEQSQPRGYDESGAVEDDIEYNPDETIAPVASSDKAPVDAVAIAPEQQDKNPFPVGKHIREGAQAGLARIMSYLQGADAAPPPAVQQAEQQVDPQGQMPESQRKLFTVANAPDDDTKFAIAQSYRKRYDAYRGFAAAALANGDIEGAAKAATQAYPNVLDGQDVVFSPNAGGVTAAVSGAAPIQLTVPQFNQWLHGNEGQYDHVMEVGAPALLQALVKSAGKQPDRTNTLTGNQGAGGLQPHDSRPMAAPGVGTPGQYQPLPPGYRSPAGPDMTVDSPARRAERARLVAGQHNGGENIAAETKSIMDQEQQSDANKINMAKAQQEYRVDAARIRAAGGTEQANIKSAGAQGVADTRAGAYRDVANIKAGVATDKNSKELQAKLANIASTAQNARERNVAAILAKKIGITPFDQPLSPGDKRAIDNLLAGQTGQSAAPATARPNAPAPAGGSQQPFKPPAGWQYSPSRGQYRDPQGQLYDKNGNPLRG